MLRNLPRIVLLADSSLEQGGGGYNRTLVNLFEAYPKDRLLLLAPRDLFTPDTRSIVEQTSLFTRYYLEPLQNRIGSYANPVIALLNSAAGQINPVNLGEIRTFNPELFIVCPNSLETILIAQKLQRQLVACPSVVYAMDDWAHGTTPPGQRGLRDWAVRGLLLRARGWMMISPELRDVFISTYKLTPPHCHIVHNPVPIEASEVPPAAPAAVFQIAYAGSIWPMHFDALAALARGIKILRDEGKAVKLLLHTPEHFWQSNVKCWTENEVGYGGNVPYAGLRSALHSSNLLAVVSSFAREFEFLSKTSLQTKLTDYMASGRPLLSCGPPDSVCNRFVREWRCGFVCENSEPERIAEFLREVIGDREQLTGCGERAFQAAKEHFESKSVCAKMYSFFNVCMKSDDAATVV